MTPQQQEVKAWFDNGSDYQQGVKLLIRFSKNRVIIHTLMKPGKEKFGGKAKLEYELMKAVGLKNQDLTAKPDATILEKESIDSEEPLIAEEKTVQPKHNPISKLLSWIKNNRK